MNIKQLRYILSVDESRHFERAAEKCFISQSTLSTMIGKFEDEIDIKVFDRKSKPVRVTEEGKVIIDKIRKIIKEVEGLDNLVQELKGEMRGKITIGVIPTIAPYLLPRFVPSFANRFPGIHISIKEMTTENILRELLNRQLDIGIAAIPLENKNLVEIPLYNEPFVLYNSRPMNT
ncbi:MAG: LysR family transcriptional regulator, partial [Saprospiraceae bacterium]|nr:LysR family transcriptional regulator [Saprospiraceae bacterium]